MVFDEVSPIFKYFHINRNNINPDSGYSKRISENVNKQYIPKLCCSTSDKEAANCKLL